MLKLTVALLLCGFGPCDVAPPRLADLDVGPVAIHDRSDAPCTSDILVHPMTCSECIARGGVPYRNEVGVCEIDNSYTCGYDFVITCTP